MKKLLVLLSTVCFGAALQAATPATGSCEQKAHKISIGQVATLRLVNEYDPGWGEFENSGAYYLAATLQRGQSYTFWIEGGNSDDIFVEIYPREVTDAEWDRGIFEPTAEFFDTAEQVDPVTKRTCYMNWMYGSDWDSGDPSSWTYYFCLSGEIGASTTFHLVSGTKTFLAEGLPDNPKVITFQDKELEAVGNITEEGCYCFKTTLTAGRKYLVRTMKGTETIPFSLNIESEEVYFDEANPDYADDKFNVARIVYPETTGTYKFVVYGAADDAFGFAYEAIPERKIDKHPWTAIADGSPETFRPGRLIADEGFYDAIVDERLFKLDAASVSVGQRWIFDARGADRPIEMRLYNSNGTLLGFNRTVGNGSTAVRLGFDVVTKGTYYVGVFDPTLAQTDTVVCAETTLTAKTVVPEKDDAADAVALSPLPGTDASDPVAEGSEVGPYTLGERRWTRTFVIGGRKGVSYRLATTFAGAETDLGLTAEVFAIVNKKETPIALDFASDDITPGHKVAFTAKDNVPCYVRISVTEGEGLDYPAFRLHSVAYIAGTEEPVLGILTVNSFGAPAATWSLDKETVKYPNGASVLLSGNHDVKFAAVTGFTTPDQRNVTVSPGKVPTVVTTYYNDSKDPGDDYTSGKIPGKTTSYAPVSWTIKNKVDGFDRTLWAEDIADNFSFSATDGYFYDFVLTNVTGDAVFSITNADPVLNETYGCSNMTAVTKRPFGKGKKPYILTVYHANSATGGSYRIEGKYANVGNIRFSSIAVSAKEDAASVKLTVNRSASDGRVRVRYATVAGTAQPGRDYYAQSGVLEWADGDKKSKDIVVRLIPDVIATYEGANRQFTVRLEPIPEDERAGDEYEAEFAYDSTKKKFLDVATVTLTETAKAAPGTIQVAGCENPKKPVVTIRAGASERIALERVLGIDGIVGVSVVSVKGTANKNGETDFEPINVTNVWEDGVGGPAAPIEIRTKRAEGDFTAKKTFTLKLTALTSKKTDAVQYAKPTLAASSITVEIVNDKYEQSVTDWAKMLPKAEGVAMKESKSGSWFRESDGARENFYSTVSRTFKGPSRLWWGPSWDPFRTNMFVSAKGETVVMRTEDVYTNDLLQATAAAAPTVDKAIVLPGGIELKFDGVPDDDKREIGYRVYVLSAGDKVVRQAGKAAVALKLGDPETEIPPPYRTNVLYTTTNKGKYTWRVDSFFIGGSVTNTAKSAWSFTVLKETEAAPAFFGGEVDEKVSSLEYGIPFELEIDAEEYALATVALVSGTGSLPTGLSLKQDADTKRWYVRGTPTKAGEFQCAIQATYKTGSTYAGKKTPSFVLKFSVADAAKAVALAPTSDKAVVQPGTHKLNFEQVEGVSYRVFFTNTANKAKLGVYDKTLKTVPTEIERPYEVTVESGSSYSWQVYSFYEGGTGSSATNKSAVFTLTGAPVDAEGRSYVTRILGQDAYGKDFRNAASADEDNTMVLRQRLPVSFEIENIDGKLKSAALLSGAGTLPTGLKIEQDKGTTKAPGTMKWYMRGTPTKAGEFSVLVQATYTNYVEKIVSGKAKLTAVETKAATQAMRFRVEAVDAPSDLSFTLTGPGRFVYTATDARIPTGRPGKTATVTNFVSKASETLKLSDVERLHSYGYVKLPTPAVLPPFVDKAVVAPETAVRLLFSKDDAADAANAIAYRVYVLSAGDKVVRQAGKAAVALKLGDPETEIPSPYETNAVYNTVNKGKYTWRVDSYFVDGPVTNVQKTAWSYSVADASKLPDDAGLARTRVIGTDVHGRTIDGEGVAGIDGKIELKRLVNVNLAVGAEGSTVTKVAGTLPTGVSLKSVEVRKEGKASIKRYFLTGTPTKAGEYALLLQEAVSYPSGRTSVSVKGTTTAFTLVVADTDLAIGTFNGILAEDGAALTNARPRIGTLQLTVSTAGKLTAKAAIAGTTHTFSGTGFTSYGQVEGALSVQLPLVKKIGTVTYTNVLTVAVRDGVSTNLVDLGRIAGHASLTMAIPDTNNKGAQDGIRYVCDLLRDNTANKDYQAAFAKTEFVGYYTVSLPILVPEFGKPQGNGYLTLTISEKGASKVAGLLSDGTSVSCSIAPGLIGDLTSSEACEFFVPVYQTGGQYAFGGVLRLFVVRDGQDGKVAIVDSMRSLLWVSDNAAATYFGDEGWSYEIIPTGGWYDTVYNLQSYFLSDRFSVDAGASDDLPEELLSRNYTFVSSTMPTGMEMLLAGNTPTVASQSLVKKIDPVTGKATSAYDWSKSINPSGLTLTFKRATGVLSGTFSAWTEDEASGSQKKVAGFKHQGILLLSRDAYSSLDSDIWTAGYFLAPSVTSAVSKKKYVGSYQFNLMAEDQGDQDWWDQDAGWNPEWGPDPDQPQD